MKVLVTGATGFIGREIVSELAENNFQIIALRRTGKLFGGEFQNVSWFQNDITEYESLADLEKIPEVDAIVHSAGLAHQFGDTKREAFDAVNIRGTENVLRLGVKLRIKHFILIGSTAVYGTGEASPNSDSGAGVTDENAPLAPATLYAESKLASEKVCRRICEENDVPLTIFRLAPVIGERNQGNVARLIGAIDKNRFIWIGDGRNLKSLIYKRDVARACALLLEAKRGETEIFNLAAEPVRMRDFVEQIAARLDKRIIPLKIPASVPRMLFSLNRRFLNFRKINKTSATVEKWLADDVYAADSILQAYNFKPPTEISEALERQIEQYKLDKVKTR